jgi:two-component system phosphate regulon response regulator PhoB
MPANILLVEDEPAIQELISLNITQAGHSLLKAFSAEQAQNLLKNVTPDLILMDWMLPGTSGYDLVRKLKSEGGTRNIPIIMLTAKDSEHDKVRSLEAGVDDYVTKPFSPRELNARIKAILRRKAPDIADDPIEIAGLLLDPAIHRVTANNNTIKGRVLNFV